MNLPLNSRGRRHDTCPHRRYVLTCMQYDELLLRCDNRCEICGTNASTQQWKKLCVDHDHRYGLWAVRGMLCHGCNRFLDQLPPTHPAVSPYLQGAWHLGMGWRLDVPVEPPLGTQVMEPWRKCWLRTEDGWARTNPRRHRIPDRLVISWAEVIHRFGAHNLRALPPNYTELRWRRLEDLSAAA